jgi:hypothetical protein
MSMSQFLKDRGNRRTETFTAWATVELSGHKGNGAVIECLVTFTQEPVVKCSSFCRTEDSFPDEGGERELISIEPHIRVKDGDLKPMECPVWLAETLEECIDMDELNASED